MIAKLRNIRFQEEIKGESPITAQKLLISWGAGLNVGGGGETGDHLIYQSSSAKIYLKYQKSYMLNTVLVPFSISFSYLLNYLVESYLLILA